MQAVRHVNPYLSPLDSLSGLLKSLWPAHPSNLMCYVNTMQLQSVIQIPGAYLAPLDQNLFLLKLLWTSDPTNLWCYPNVMKLQSVCQWTNESSQTVCLLFGTNRLGSVEPVGRAVPDLLWLHKDIRPILCLILPPCLAHLFPHVTTVSLINT